jgi:hypothetical protein
MIGEETIGCDPEAPVDSLTMGRRSGTETAIAVLAAFIGKNTWEQASLARRVGVTSRTLRVCLDDLVRHGVPLERFDESQREIWWSVRKGWLPDAAPLGADDLRATFGIASSSAWSVRARSSSRAGSVKQHQRS